MIILKTTLASKEDAAKLAGAILEQKLAACVQTAKIDSMYMWQNEIASSSEYALEIKTLKALQGQIISYIESAHPYRVAQIVVVDCANVADEYYQWVVSVTKKP